MAPRRAPGPGFVLFRLGPIEIAVHPSWFFIFGVLVLIAHTELVPDIVGEGGSGWAPLLSIGIALLFYTFIVAHELSHAIVARAHGIDARRITLFIFGGVAQIGGEAQHPGDEFRIAVAGPLTSLLIAGVLAVAARSLHPNANVEDLGLWGYLALINLALALFNLIPAFPLDGGRLLRAGLWRGLRDRARATRWSAALGRGFALLLIGAGGGTVISGVVSGEGPFALPGIWYVAIGYFLFTMAGAAGRAEGGAEPRKPGDRPGEPVRPPDPPVNVRTHEGNAAQSAPAGRGAGPDLGSDAARQATDQSGDGARHPRVRPPHP